MPNFRYLWRQLSRANSYNNLIITLLFVILYVALLQIIVNVLFQVFNLSSSSPENREHSVLGKKLHDNIKDKFSDNNNEYAEDEDFDMLDHNNDDYARDVRLIKGHEDSDLAQDRDAEYSEVSKKPWSTQDAIIKRTKDCKKYFDNYPVLYFNRIIEKYEKKTLKPAYSLAFSHLLHKEIAIYEAFLSIYFRPNDFYCIHVDKESKEKVWKAVEGLVKCYSSKMIHGKIVLLDKKESFKVHWAQDQMLKADIKCIERLLELRKGSKSPWRYSISMAGSELPLVTYATLRSRLTNALGNDGSSVESFTMPNYQLKRRLSKKAMADCTICPDEKNTEVRKWKSKTPLQFEFTNPLKTDKKYTMRVYKGLRSVILSYKDADFMVNHPVGKQFYQWIEKSSMTEEHFYSSLIRVKVDSKTSLVTQNTDATREDILHGIQCIRYTHWYYGVRMGGKTYKRKACFGNFIHAICNFNSFDVGKLHEGSEKCLIGNKFGLDVDKMAVVVHWSNLLSKSFEETGKFSRTMSEYSKGNERNFTKHYHKKIKDLVNW